MYDKCRDMFEEYLSVFPLFNSRILLCIIPEFATKKVLLLWRSRELYEVTVEMLTIIYMYYIISFITSF